MAAKRSSAAAAIRALRTFGLRYPGAHTKSPWPGHLDLAVKDKTFAYLPPEGEPFSISCKLPETSHVALMLPWTAPTGYGLGKSGWVSATPPPGTPIPIAMFEQWIDESYRAQAPRSLVKQLGAPAIAATPKRPRKRASTRTPRRPAAKRPARPKARARARG